MLNFYVGLLCILSAIYILQVHYQIIIALLSMIKLAGSNQSEPAYLSRSLVQVGHVVLQLSIRLGVVKILGGIWNYSVRSKSTNHVGAS